MSEQNNSPIMDSNDMERAIMRISHEIIEKNRELSSLVLVGIHTRGVPIAKRIARNINKLRSVDIPFGELDITFYRDDFSTKGAILNAAKTDIPSGLPGKTIILVDDVLYTGRSIRAAVDHLLDYGRPARVQLAVLLDRGHRELPIRPDYVGKNIPTAKGQLVRVKLNEIDGKDCVLLTDADSD